MPTLMAEKDGKTYHMPFEPYGVQKEMIKVINASLLSAPSHAPIAAVEVPTGCGKTVALLSSVLQYQAALGKLSQPELERHMRERRCRSMLAASPSMAASNLIHSCRCECNATAVCHNKKDESSADTDAVIAEERWRPPQLFFKMFRTQPGKRLRVETENPVSELRRQHDPPPCTIFYVTRTHAQVKQAVGELRKLRDLDKLKMNILGSRAWYCINQKVQSARANKTLPVEGNNLGEVCDKLVSLGQCEAVHTYASLANRAITRPLRQGCAEKVWDIEDLVSEGVGMQSCPYYAARDLVFFAHVNFATYQYLLDPIIRHECKMEGALKNNAIVVFDEAHNVPHVCQEALSLETTTETLQLVISELEPLIHPEVSMGTLSYPREFRLTHWTLVEILSLLHDLFGAILRFANDHQPSAPGGKTSRHPCGVEDADTTESNEQVTTLPGEALAKSVWRCIMDHTPLSSLPHGANVALPSGSALSSGENAALFRQAYGIVMSLGVTYNPFQFSIFGLSIMKRWLLVLRFVIEKPGAFAVGISGACCDTDGSAACNISGRHEERERVDAARVTIAVQCLDGSVAFRYLLASVHRVVLASGTLAPFRQLGQELGVPPTSMVTYEGGHVVGKHQYRFVALTRTGDATPLQCTYETFRSNSFVESLVATLIRLIDQVRTGGVLLFLPNYHVMRAVGSRLALHYERVMCARRRDAANHAAREGGNDIHLVPHIFLECQKSEEFSLQLGKFQAATAAGPAVLASVFRAKVGEGINFADHMARLVVCVGVPLRPLKLWTVAAQRQYSGEEWYITDAIRTVNQAAGRCIRHLHDYGAVVLLDGRFDHPGIQQRLSGWCRRELKVYHALGPLEEDLCQFYRYLSLGDVGQVRQDDEVKPKLEMGAHKSAREATSQSSGSARPSLVADKLQVEHMFPIISLPPYGPPPKKSHTPMSEHELSGTALKLLCEECDTDGQVTAVQLRDAIQALEREFMHSHKE
ncbi:DEAD 2 Helicase C terminal domain [Trypanosoma vivax]|nr:DEAD 2 Helicase C terminal domain [Trypanosoma vivax]